MRKYYLEQDEIDAFVQVLQLPHVLPIQGPYAIKLLKALAAATKSTYGDSKALNEAAETLLKSYESFITNFTAERAQTFTADPLGSLLLEIARVSLTTDADTEFISLTGQLQTRLLPESTENHDRLPDDYSATIVNYLNTIFHPTVKLPGHTTLLPDHPKAPLPIEHDLIKIERGSDDCFSAPEAAQAAYDRAVIIGCALRSALHDVGAVDGTQDTSISDATLTKATSTATSLVCRAVLRAKSSNNPVYGFEWSILEPYGFNNKFDFSDEHYNYNQCWQTHIRGSTDNPAFDCAKCHGLGAQAFLAPALHMLGCSQVAAVGNRAWPAVYQDMLCVNGTAKCDYFLDDFINEETFTRASYTYKEEHSNSCVALFGRSVLLSGSHVINRRSTVDGIAFRQSDGVHSTYIEATASRPDVLTPPTAKRDGTSCNFDDIMSVELTTGRNADNLIWKLLGHRGLSILLTVEDEPAQNVSSETKVGRPNIPNSGAIYLSAMHAASNGNETEFVSHLSYAKTIATKANFPETDTQNWIVETICEQIRQKVLYTNFAAWFRAMIDTPAHHFEPMYSCRAFNDFTGDFGSVAGIIANTPVSIYFSKNDLDDWDFHVDDPVNRTPGTVHIIRCGTWTKPAQDNNSAVTYNLTVIPYLFSVNSTCEHLPITVVGSHLAKRVLGARGIDCVESLDQLLVEGVPLSLAINLVTEKPSDLVAAGAMRGVVNEAISWSNVETFVKALEDYMPPHRSFIASLSANQPLIAAPTHESRISNPAPVIGFLVWAFTGQYRSTWSADWASAAVALLPPDLRPGSDVKAEKTGYRRVMNAMLISCVNAVSDNDYDDVKDLNQLAAKYLETELTKIHKNAATAIPTSSTDSSLPADQSEAGSPLAALRLPSMAMNWVHLVFCVMHKIAPLPDLIEHPFMFNLNRRRNYILNIGMHANERPAARAISHNVHQALRANDKTVAELTDALQANYESLRKRHKRVSWCAAFILARHVMVHAYNEIRAENLQLFGGLVSTEKVLVYFGTHFPVLELAAWLIFTSGLLDKPLKSLTDIEDIDLDTFVDPLTCVAKSTLVGLGCSGEAFRTAAKYPMKAFAKNQDREETRRVENAFHLATKIINETQMNDEKELKTLRLDYSVTELDDIMKAVFSTENLFTLESIINQLSIFRIPHEPWNKILEIKVPYTISDIQFTPTNDTDLKQIELLSSVFSVLRSTSRQDLYDIAKLWCSKKTSIVNVYKSFFAKNRARRVEQELGDESIDIASWWKRKLCSDATHETEPFWVAMTAAGPSAAHAVAQLAVKIIQHIDEASRQAARDKLTADHNSKTIDEPNSYGKKKFNTLEQALYGCPVRSPKLFIFLKRLMSPLSKLKPSKLSTPQLASPEGTEAHISD